MGEGPAPSVRLVRECMQLRSWRQPAGGPAVVQKPEPSLPMVGQHMQVGSVVWSPQHLAIAQEPRPSSAWCQETCMRTASQSGQLEILQWLRSQDPPCL